MTDLVRKTHRKKFRQPSLFLSLGDVLPFSPKEIPTAPTCFSNSGSNNENLVENVDCAQIEPSLQAQEARHAAAADAVPILVVDTTAEAVAFPNQSVEDPPVGCEDVSDFRAPSRCRRLTRRRWHSPPVVDPIQHVITDIHIRIEL